MLRFPLSVDLMRQAQEVQAQLQLFNEMTPEDQAIVPDIVVIAPTITVSQVKVALDYTEGEANVGAGTWYKGRNVHNVIAWYYSDDYTTEKDSAATIVPGAEAVTAAYTIQQLPAVAPVAPAEAPVNPLTPDQQRYLDELQDGVLKDLKRKAFQQTDVTVDELRPVTLAENIKPLAGITVGDVNPRTLEQEFQHNQSMVDKIRLLSDEYKAWQPIRGDGNCFYRAAGFSLLTRVLTRGAEAAEARRAQELASLIEAIEAVKLSQEEDKGTTISIGFTSGVNEQGQANREDVQGDPFNPLEAKELLLKRLRHVQNGGNNWLAPDATVAPPSMPLGAVAEEELYTAVLNPQGTDSTDFIIVKLLRRMVAAWLHAYGDEATPSGITYNALAAAMHDGLKNFVKTTVEPMGVEAETIVLQVLPRVLRLSMRVIYLDRTEGNELGKHDFAADPGEAADDGEKAAPEDVPIHILLKPGHYDVLFPRDKADREARVAARAAAG